ncbi:Flp pilus assembly protein CpaB [Ideonella dechloratans]|uniref:Flp pilus assembly protein CpaB n=1 Tax=Ideonella dechloratans TaxID=36863 RepID=UPI0035B2E514
MAIPRFKLNTNWLLLGVAIALGGGAVYLSNTLIRDKMAQLEADAKRGQQTVEVVVAKRDLAPGDTISSDVMAVRQVPREYVPETAVLPDGFGSVERQRLAAPIRRGEMLLTLHTEGNGTLVFSSTLKKGLRALTFEVDAVNSISGMLRPGDFIDLIYSAKGPLSGDGDVTVPLLSQVQVLATDQSVTKHDDGTGTERSFTTVTLQVSPLDADRIIAAKAAGQLTAVLRHPDDGQPNTTRPMTAAGLLSGVAAAPTGHTIEYIAGGSSAEPAEVHQARTAQISPLAAAAAARSLATAAAR